MRLRTAGAAALALALAASCGTSAPDATVERTEDSFRVPVRNLPVDDIRVFRSVPVGVPVADVWIVMTGTGRNAREYRDRWSSVVAGGADLVLTPEFDEADFPGSEGYNLANMVDQDARANPPEEWLFAAIDAVFAAAASEFDLAPDAAYRLFGHSAGAQFVTRMVTFQPSELMCRAYAANAGWYTLPDPRIPFPYGLRNAPPPGADLREAFGTPMRILLGTRDTDHADPNLRHDELSDQQGPNRLERGVHYYAVAQEQAAAVSAPFWWTMQLVPEVAHDGAAMSRAAFDSATQDPTCRRR